MIPIEPGSFSAERIGPGFKISNTRNKKKAAPMEIQESLGMLSKAAPIPTHSSITMNPGSSRSASGRASMVFETAITARAAVMRNNVSPENPKRLVQISQTAI